MDAERIQGARAELFEEMTRTQILRYITEMDVDQLLELLGHLIVQRRNAYKAALNETQSGTLP